MEKNVAEAKTQLRLEMLEARSNISSEARSQDLAHHLLSLCERLSAKTVGVYLSFGQEPDTWQFVRQALLAGVSLAAPKVTGNSEMDFYKYDGTTLKSSFGFEEPTGPLVSPAELDLIIAPALAASRSGKRLGRGAGFYDRYLNKSSTPVAAVVFSTEVLDFVPSQGHDQSVDYVVTPDGVLICQE